tara:strand:+ start:111 stop:383 length:273 start_codon:yes stop_codon:yes gene_type:complete
MYNILFFILIILILVYVIKHIVARFYPTIRTGVSDIVLLDRYRLKREDNLVETITREQFVKKIPPENLERDQTMTHYHINRRVLDKKHLL